MKQERKARIDFEQLRRTVPITAVLEKYGILGTLKRSGAQLKGPCPIHGGTKSRSFVVDPQKNVWNCFSPSCAKGGGMLELVAAMEKMEIPDSARLVARWFAIKREKTTSHRTPRRTR